MRALIKVMADVVGQEKQNNDSLAKADMGEFIPYISLFLLKRISNWELLKQFVHINKLK